MVASKIVRFYVVPCTGENIIFLIQDIEMLCYDIINEIATFMKVTDNEKIKALCDVCDVPYEWVPEIRKNEEVLKTKIDWRELFPESVSNYHFWRRRTTKRVGHHNSVEINMYMFFEGLSSQYWNFYVLEDHNMKYHTSMNYLPQYRPKTRLLRDFLDFWVDNPIDLE